VASKDRSDRRDARAGERGQILPLLAFGVFALLSMIALVVDIGYSRYQQRLEQAASDSAAVAGAVRLYYGSAAAAPAPTGVIAAAKSAASENGFADDNGAGKLVVSVYSPPRVNQGPAANATPYPANSAVEVTINKLQPTFFATVFGGMQPTVGVRSVAVQQIDTSGCLYQLKLAGNGGELRFTGNKPVHVINCGVVVNGQINAQEFDPSTTSVDYYYPNTPITNFDPSKLHSMPQPVADPCFKIPGCAYLQNQPFPGSSQAVDVSGSQSYSVPNGQSYGVIKNCCSGSTLLNPGLYYIYGGVSGTILGDGVTIVNVDGGFTASGLGSAHPYFSAPTSGPTKGVAFYQPPSNTNGITLNGGGNGTTIWDGLFYAPTADFVANGGSVTFAFTITGSITDHGGGSGNGITVDPTLGGLVPLDVNQYPTHVVLTE